MNIRKITSMTMLVSFILLLVNSVILYIVPEGRVAYWADWHMGGLTKTQWGDQHVTVGVLFLVASFLHMFFNWPVITAYMKNKAREMKVFTGSFNAALVITLLVAIGTYYEVPPMSTIIHISGEIKDGGAKKYGEPPYGHAELSSLKLFSKKEGLDADKALELMKEAGLKAESTKETLKNIAANNNLTPQQVYEIIKVARIEGEAASAGDSVATAAVSFPDHPKPGFGKRSLEEVCVELGINMDLIVNGLKAMGIDCSGSQSIKDIGEASGKEPMEIFEAIRSLVVKD
ncbi:DUF4405 domain-containing protein [Desulfopila aestuarii]|uniref:Flavinylation-associated cytochrome domain-containing protein n=1 Tax=Desulfopila aestuarii DSM 18488 TaxID=1121416 RepID=A0A1M7Y752_9BACT|nr:DUF4405 domain-containing protein [Desulfopila aestuarii]SHO48440.1 protein of unknown function [Desulfopila aestuarii DSM 18488]